VLSVETASAAMVELLDPERNASVLISGQRAASLGLGNAGAAGDLVQPVQLQRTDWLDRDSIRALADPALDFDRGPIGPLTAEPLLAPEEAGAAIALARLSGILPALWLVNGAAETATSVTAAEVRNSLRHSKATIVARAKLPLDGLPPSQMITFRDQATGEDHVALVIGAFAGEPPLVRLHSECLTGDVFGSLKCDCGPQLKEALAILGREGGGVLLYLRQEGRGIGLANKLRAYELQDRGLDTVEANRRLGFADDERDYGVAASMLRALGIASVRLLTNNPAKVEGLRSEGIAIEARVPHHMPTNPHNADYIATKKHKSGHLP